MPEPSPVLTMRSRELPENAAHIIGTEDAIRAQFFDASGVLLPRMTYEQDKDVTDGRCEIALNGKWLASAPSGTPVDALTLPYIVASQLVEHAAELLTPLLVDRYLLVLNEGFPELVRAARGAFSLDELTERLRRRLASGLSIKDFRGVLEMLLYDAK